MERIISELDAIPETMLIPLWAKATETMRKDALLVDSKAVEIMQKIDYDFSKFRKAKASQVGCCIRAKLIDEEVTAFLNEHPDAVVIQLGAGIDARYERLGSPMVTHWFDLDLEEAIKLRKKFLNETACNTYIAASLFDESWIERVKTHEKPVLIIIEGVLMYFEPERVEAFFKNLCTKLQDATVLFDMLAYTALKHSKQHDALKKMKKNAEFKWSLLHTNDMESWHPALRMEKEYYMSNYDEGKYPLLLRLLYRLPYFYMHFNQRVVKLHIGEKFDRQSQK